MSSLRGNKFLLAFLVFINILNFVDRQLIASFANDITTELDLSATEFGILTGFAFTVFYSVAGLFVGSLIDTGNRPRLIAVGLALWSGFTALTGKATSFVGMMLPRMFIGVGESIQTPASISMLAERFPQKRMGLIAGIYYMGVPVGAGLSLLLVGYLGPVIGWRNCFYLMGVIGLLSAAVLLLFKESPTRLAAISERQASGSHRLREMWSIAKVVLAETRNNPALRWTMIGGVLVHIVLGAASFEQLWFVQEMGYDKSYIAAMSGFFLMIGGAIGNVFGGLAGDWFANKTRFSRAAFLALLQVIVFPIMVAYRWSEPDGFLFFLGLFTFSFGLGCFYGPSISTVQALAPAHVRATGVALYILGLNLIGLGMGGLIGGVAVDTLASLDVGRPYTWALTGLAVLTALSIPAYFKADHYIRAHQHET